MRETPGFADPADKPAQACYPIEEIYERLWNRFSPIVRRIGLSRHGELWTEIDGALMDLAKELGKESYADTKRLEWLIREHAVVEMQNPVSCAVEWTHRDFNRVQAGNYAFPREAIDAAMEAQASMIPRPSAEDVRDTAEAVHCRNCGGFGGHLPGCQHSGLWD